MTKICVVHSQKGGATKSATCSHMAIAAQLAGYKVALLDCDPQGSLREWAKDRADAALLTPGIRYMPEGADLHGWLTDAIAKARSLGIDLVIVDTPPRLAADTAVVAAAADMILVPMIPDPTDLRATRRTIETLHALEVIEKVRVLISAAPPKRSPILENAWVAEAQEVVREAFQAPLAPVIVRSRVAVRRSLGSGKTVFEDADEKASKEFAELFAWLSAEIGLEPKEINLVAAKAAAA